VILSLPISISVYLPRNPAIISLGPIMSSNRMLPFCPCERTPSTQARLLESRIDIDLLRRATKDWQRTAGRDHQDSLQSAGLLGITFGLSLIMNCHYRRLLQTNCLWIHLRWQNLRFHWNYRLGWVFAD
jgi:hypothetical protein